MNTCPITYHPCGEDIYSPEGLKLLSPRLKALLPFPMTAKEQRQASAAMADKLSIQGVQSKMSARLDVAAETFLPVAKNGQYILKPQSDLFLQLPENEDLTMRLAALVGIETPLHGLIYSHDRSLTYFIKRFDRQGRNTKFEVEDFSQLLGVPSDQKYQSSMERIAEIVERFCTNPQEEKIKLFRLTIFNFLVGNEDMHLKNFSLINRNAVIKLSPAYDLLNTTLALGGKDLEEIALSIAGKKRKLNQAILIDYFGKQRLKLKEESIASTINSFKNIQPQWAELLSISFMSQEMKNQYATLLQTRLQILNLNTK